MNAIILFTKAPIEGFCKTRLYDFLSPQNAANLQKHLIDKNLKIITKANAKTFIYVDGKCEFEGFDAQKQRGKDLGEKMHNAFEEVLNLRYEKVILIGSDLANLSLDILNLAFEILDTKDVVISPSSDGGYSLIGLKKPCFNVFELDEFSNSSVFDKTLKILKEENLSFDLVDEILDIDTIDDIANFIVKKESKFLAKGEYNANFTFEKDNKKQILRIKKASQIEYENPSLYEYNALKFLEPLGITPKVYDFYEKSVFLPFGGFSMEFLEGKSLDYDSDLLIAANLLSKLHSFSNKNAPLIEAKKPFLNIYEECVRFSNSYENFSGKTKEILNFLEFFKENLLPLGLNNDITNKSIINTELNNSNFIIGKNSYIIDWEKPLIGDSEQDLAHFLAPTTTFFKSDKILNKTEIYKFLNEYSKTKSFDENLLDKYFKFTCFRGFSWCAYAYVQANIFRVKSPAYKKIKAYLNSEFIDFLKGYFKNGS